MDANTHLLDRIGWERLALPLRDEGWLPSHASTCVFLVSGAVGEPPLNQERPRLMQPLQHAVVLQHPLYHL